MNISRIIGLSLNLSGNHLSTPVLHIRGGKQIQGTYPNSLVAAVLLSIYLPKGVLVLDYPKHMGQIFTVGCNTNQNPGCFSPRHPLCVRNIAIENWEIVR